jgi:hypothetical protein
VELQFLPNNFPKKPQDTPVALAWGVSEGVKKSASIRQKTPIRKILKKFGP